jgi:hypothetical protein
VIISLPPWRVRRAVPGIERRDGANYSTNPSKVPLSPARSSALRGFFVRLCWPSDTATKCVARC